MLKLSQKEQADARDAALAAEHGSDQAEPENEDEDDTVATATPKSSKTARAYAKTYKPGPPLVPHIIVQRLLQYISKVVIRQKEKFVLMVCRYWSLKREARRGAPLLKRLHLEPWSGAGGTRGSIGRGAGETGAESEEAIAQRLQVCPFMPTFDSRS